jgi:hypothetical protein
MARGAASRPARAHSRRATAGCRLSEPWLQHQRRSAPQLLLQLHLQALLLRLNSCVSYFHSQALIVTPPPPLLF